MRSALLIEHRAGTTAYWVALATIRCSVMRDFCGTTSRAGDDCLEGGADDDELAGDGYEMFDQAIGGMDRLCGGGNRDTLYGDAKLRMSGDCLGGNDDLNGGSDRDTIYGDAYFLTGNARGGNDTILGGASHDTIYGDCNELSGGASAGSDRIFGGNGNDRIWGDAQFRDGPLVCGGDLIVGGGGDDVLFGDAGGTGDAGADTFRFAPGSGRDIIFDFGVGTDKIDVRGYGFASLGELAIEISGFDTIIDMDGTGGDVNEVTVLFRTNLTASDFIFA